MPQTAVTLLSFPSALHTWGAVSAGVSNCPFPLSQPLCQKQCKSWQKAVGVPGGVSQEHLS